MNDNNDIRLLSLCNTINSVTLTIRELSVLFKDEKLRFNEQNFLDLQMTIFYLSDSIHNIGYPLYSIDNDSSIERIKVDISYLLDKLETYKSKEIFNFVYYRNLLLNVISDLRTDIENLESTL